MTPFLLPQKHSVTNQSQRDRDPQASRTLMCQPRSSRECLRSIEDSGPLSAQQWLRKGQWVRAKSFQEIQCTLDASGRTEGLPFMAEMLPFCGKTLRIQERADTVCVGGLRRLDRVCHLQNSRCSGDAHGTCQAGCLLYWHEAWLQPVPGLIDLHPADDVEAHLPPAFNPSTSTYTCQLTEARKLGTEIPVPGLQEYLRKCWVGQIRTAEAKYLFRWSFDRLLVAFYSWLRRYSRSGFSFDQFKVGDLVRVRSRTEILRSMGRNGSHRGLRITADMLRYCGKSFRIAGRVTQMIDDKTGRLRNLKNECYILAGVTCAGGRLLCSREQHYYWRAIWLQKAESKAITAVASGIDDSLPASQSHDPILNHPV
jgi:hypothetical protein